MKSLAYAVAGALVAAAVVSGNVPPPPPVPQPAPPPPARAAAWEYRVVRTTPFPENDEKRLNELGADGWEVTESVAHANEARVVLRRPKR